MSIADKLLTVAENEQKIHDEVVGQSDLIAQIKAKVNSLPEAGGSGGVNIAAGIVDGTITEITAQDLMGATKIRDYAFYTWRGLKNITIPDSVTSIGSGAFYGCGLTSIVISNSVTSIGSNAFYACSGLKSVVIGNSVTTIGNYAFQNCSELTSIIIPDSVTSIGNSGFSGSGLTSVIMGNSVSTIGSSAFYYNQNLKRVDFSKHTTIPTLKGSTAFDSTHSILQIKVPANLINGWKAATNWSTYADKIVTEFTNTL